MPHGVNFFHLLVDQYFECMDRLCALLPYQARPGLYYGSSAKRKLAWYSRRRIVFFQPTRASFSSMFLCDYTKKVERSVKILDVVLFLPHWEQLKKDAGTCYTAMWTWALLGLLPAQLTEVTS